MSTRKERPEPRAARRNAGDVATDGAVRYRERLRTPWWWYPIGLGVASLLAAEFRIADLHLTVWIPFGTLLPAAVLIVWSLGRSKLEVIGDEVRVRGATLPLKYVSGAIALDAATLRRVVGREGDPAAFVSVRPWIGPGVQLWLDDPDDPAPYWLLSSRRPHEFAQVIRDLL